MANSEDAEVYRALTDDNTVKTLTKVVTYEAKNVIFLYISTFTVCLVLFTGGCDLVWTSPVLPKLHSNDSDVNTLGAPITPLEESLIASAYLLGALIGSLLLSKLPDIFGRKNVLIFIALVKLIFYVTLALTGTAFWYYTSRFFLGIATGMALALVPIFVAETCKDHNRGKFGSFVSLFITLGNLYGFIVGALVTVRDFTLLCGAPLVLNLFILILFIPDTPIYLITKGRQADALHALRKFRQATPEESQRALEQIEQILSKRTSNGKWTSLFKTAWLRKAMVACVGVAVLKQLAGITPIVGFIGPVFDTAGCKLSGNTSAIIVGIVQVVSFALASQVVDKLGRRILLITSSIATGLDLVALGAYFYLLNAGVNLESVSWLSVVFLILYFITSCFGIGPIPMILMSEMFPMEVKSFAAAFVSFSTGASAFLTMLVFPPMLNFLGAAWCFWLFSVFCMAGAIFVYFLVPETKGKNINEIQRALL